MAPERFESRPVDGRADVYSLACMLFELLTGAPPFHGRTPVGMIHAHMSLDPPRPSAQRPGLPPGLDAVATRGMAKRPEHRYPSAGALVAAARAVLRDPQAQAPPAEAQARPPHGAAPAPRGQPPWPAQSRPPQTPAPHTPIPQAPALPRQAPAAQTRAPQTPVPAQQAPHRQAPTAPTPAPRTPVPAQEAPHRQAPTAPTPAPRTPVTTPHASPREAPAAQTPTPRAPLSLRKAAAPTQRPAPTSTGYRPAPPRPWPPPPAYPARPASMVLALVLQVVSGGLFLLGSLFGAAGGGGIAMALVAAFYVLCAVLAFGGRGWARVTLAVINGLFGALCLIALPIMLAESADSAGENAGAAFGLLVLIGMAVACTLPMFTRAARAFARPVGPGHDHRLGAETGQS